MLPKRSKKDLDVLLRFIESRCIKVDDCLIWTGALVTGGNGGITVDSKSYIVHRLAFEIRYGELPPFFYRSRAQKNSVLHTCDHPACIEDKHLFLGSQQDNIRDMISKGRRADFHGENSPVVKLTSVQVDTIRARVAAGESQVSIAAAFSIHQSQVSRIVNRMRRAYG